MPVQRSASTSFSKTDLISGHYAAEFKRDALGSPRAQTAADVIATDDEVLPVVAHPRTSTWTCGLSVFQ